MKKQRSLLMIVILFSVFNFGCDKKKEILDGPILGPQLFIYQTKCDYRKNIFVRLDKTQTIITYNPRQGDITPVFPTELANGFLAPTGRNGLIGVNCVPTSITLFDTIGYNMDWINLVIDKAPFISFYEAKNKNWLIDDFDTNKVNKIILNGEIEKYFTKLK